MKARRGEIVNDIREAREQGDLRENHAYHAVKDAQGMIQGMIEARIADLESAGVKICKIKQQHKARFQTGLIIIHNHD